MISPKTEQHAAQIYTEAFSTAQNLGRFSEDELKEVFSEIANLAIDAAIVFETAVKDRNKK